MSDMRVVSVSAPPVFCHDADVHRNMPEGSVIQQDGSCCGGAAPEVSRTRAILLGVQGGPEGVLFASDPETCSVSEVAPVERQTEVLVPMSVYVSMGQPDEITVTIEPGDRLNDE